MATTLRASGVPHWEVEGILGHKMPTTSERYAKYDPNYLGMASKAIDEYMLACEATIVEQREVFFNG